MTNGELLVNFIKETFPDLVEAVEDNGKKIVYPDEICICDFISCGGCYCDDCVIEQNNLSKHYAWAKQEYTGPIKISNSTTAITSGEISW